MYLKIVVTSIGIFLLRCAALPNLIPEIDEGSTYKEPANNPNLDNIVDAEEQQIRAFQDWLENTPEGQIISTFRLNLHWKAKKPKNEISFFTF